MILQNGYMCLYKYNMPVSIFPIVIPHIDKTHRGYGALRE